jgi:hypothetical protein
VPTRVPTVRRSFPGSDRPRARTPCRRVAHPFRTDPVGDLRAPRCRAETVSDRECGSVRDGATNVATRSRMRSVALGPLNDSRAVSAHPRAPARTRAAPPAVRGEHVHRSTSHAPRPDALASHGAVSRPARRSTDRSSPTAACSWSHARVRRHRLESWRPQPHRPAGRKLDLEHPCPPEAVRPRLDRPPRRRPRLRRASPPRTREPTPVVTIDGAPRSGGRWIMPRVKRSRRRLRIARPPNLDVLLARCLPSLLPRPPSLRELSWRMRREERSFGPILAVLRAAREGGRRGTGVRS